MPPVCRFESREAELHSLRTRVTELGSEMDAAQESEQQTTDALRAQLGAQHAELEASRTDLAATQARPVCPAPIQSVTCRQLAGGRSVWEKEGGRSRVVMGW